MLLGNQSDEENSGHNGHREDNIISHTRDKGQFANAIGQHRETKLFNEDAIHHLWRPPLNMVDKKIENLPVTIEFLPACFIRTTIQDKSDSGFSLNRFDKNRGINYPGSASDKQIYKELTKIPREVHIFGEDLGLGSDVDDIFLSEADYEAALSAWPVLATFDRTDNDVDDVDPPYLLKDVIAYRNRAINSTVVRGVLERKNKPCMIPEDYCKNTKSSTNSSSKEFKAAIAESLLYHGKNKPCCMPIPMHILDECLDLEQDTIITMRVYKHVSNDMSENQCLQNKASRDLMLYHDLNVTGFHKLAEVKETHMCNNTAPNYTEKSDTGIFCIKNCFYLNKSRSTTDQIDSLRKWHGVRNFINLPKLESRYRCIDELNFQLGKPEVYIHNDGCEHIIVFIEDRPVNIKDPPRSSFYPRITGIAENVGSPFCYKCGDDTPKWIISHCTILPLDKALYCQQCFEALLHDVEGKRTSKFQAYPYKGA